MYTRCIIHEGREYITYTYPHVPYTFLNKYISIVYMLYLYDVYSYI